MTILEKFIAFFVKRHPLTSPMFITVFIGGVMAWNGTSKVEIFDVEFDHVHALLY